MNAPDVNLLVYAYDSLSPFHARAKAYMEHALNNSEPFGLPVLSVHGFVRIITRLTTTEPSLRLPRALHIVDEWLSQPNAVILSPGPMHWSILKTLSLQSQASGRLFTDAAIAAIAIEHDATIQTNDRDFARFPNVRWHNPLA